MNFSVNAIQNFSNNYDITMPNAEPVSLEDRIIQAYAKTATNAELEQNDVISKLQQDKVTSDPGELFRLQQRTSDYNLQISLISTLTRKGVSVVETLLRS